MYTCKHFSIKELVPRHVHKDRGNRAWELFDDRALETLDALREQFGRATVNNWAWNGNREWSGLRTPESPYGTQYSQHRLGRAFDVIFSEKTAEEAREYVLANEEEFPYIRGIELGVSWFHFDIGNRRGEGIFTFHP